MSLNSALETAELTQLVDVLHESLKVRSRREFLLWSQGSLQQFLPHDIMIVAWGNFSLCLVQFDIVSSIPRLHTEQMHSANLAPTLKRLFDYWNAHSRAPFQVRVNEGLFPADALQGGDGVDGSFHRMKSALVHAIKDERGGGRHDCLYVLMSASNSAPAADRHMLEILLPYIDSSLRQVAQDTGDDDAAPTEPESADLDTGPLSARELEIMEWVRNGKTNVEIGMILDISAFTVKNHLQRIFRKLDVVNRAQAVAKLGRALELHEPA